MFRKGIAYALQSCNLCNSHSSKRFCMPDRMDLALCLPVARAPDRDSCTEKSCHDEHAEQECAHPDCTKTLLPDEMLLVGAGTVKCISDTCIIFSSSSSSSAAAATRKQHQQESWRAGHVSCSCCRQHGGHHVCLCPSVPGLLPGHRLWRHHPTG